jgi:hypothetical protein
MSNAISPDSISAQAQAGHNNSQDNSSHQIHNYFGLPTGKDQAQFFENLIKGQGGNSKKGSYDDWHMALPDRRWGITSFPDSEAKMRALKAGGQILIDCVDAAILHDASTWIASQTTYGQKMLVCRTNKAFFEEPDQVNLAAYVNYLKSWWPEQAASVNGPLLVVFHLDDRLLSGAFLRSLGTLAAFQGGMKQIHLVFLLFPDAREYVPQNTLRGQIEVWRLPAAPLLVRRALGAGTGDPETESRLQKVLQTIEQQRRQRRWAPDDAAHAREIWTLMDQGGDVLEVLEKEVVQRTAEVALENIVPGRNMPTAHVEVARRGTVVEKAVLFTAAFCNRCSIHEQKLILEPILAGRQFKPEMKAAAAARFKGWRMPVKGRQAVNTETTTDGDTSAASPYPTVDAFEFWSANDQDVMDRCGVVCITSADGTRQVGFSQEGMAEMVRQTLSDSFVVDCFEAVSHRMIFHLEASPMLVDKLVRLAAEMCVRYPDRFGDAWLRDVLNSIHKVWALSLVAEIHNLGAWYQQLRIELKEKGVMLSRLNSRLATLCEAMMQRPASQKIAIRFIDSLLSEGAYGIVIRLAKRLRSIESESCFKWLKRSLDEAPEEDKTAASEAIFEVARTGVAEVDQVIGGIFGWMPDTGREIRRISPSERFALLFPLLLLQNLKDQALSLLAQRGINSPENRWKLLVKWLCHPKLRELLADDPDMWEEPDEIISYSMTAWALHSGGFSQTIIDEFRVQAPPRQVQATRAVFGKLLGEADKAWLKAADLSYRNPLDASRKHAAVTAKQTLELLKSSWRRLGERAAV